MMPIVHALLGFVLSTVRSRVALQLEVVALRHLLAVYKRSSRRPSLRLGDRFFWVWLARHWGRWREVLVFVQPATVIDWQRKRFRDYWARLSHRRSGRPRVSRELRVLIRDISIANLRWGSPRILGELRKLGIEMAKSTIEKYHIRPSRAASFRPQKWAGYITTMNGRRREGGRAKGSREGQACGVHAESLGWHRCWAEHYFTGNTRLVRKSSEVD